ncbi:MAG: hypothetical protein N2043_00920 [Ignavibacterium sp.]|nr:hypothetical protein [Ignavibacterium sp.]
MTKKEITYIFEFEEGNIKRFDLAIDLENMLIINNSVEKPPDWTLLKNFSCPHCPLNPNEHLYCPLALNLVKMIDEFNEHNSFDRVKVTVITDNRTFYKETDLQSGVSSYLGILMVASGCPVMKKLSPMLHFHLPFATLEETEIRVFSLYLLAQLIKMKQGEEPDWDMKKLFDIYEDIRILNNNVSKKVADLEKKDANINSIVILNNFADFVTFTLNEKLIDELSSYLKEFLN